MAKDLKAIQEATAKDGSLPVAAPNGKALVPSLDSDVVRNGQRQWTRARDALQRSADKRDDKGVTRIQRMADRVMNMAIEGNMQAVHFVTDRLDGKGVQQIDMKQDITVSSIGEAHLHALQRLTDAVSRHDEATRHDTLDTQSANTIEGEANTPED